MQPASQFPWLSKDLYSSLLNTTPAFYAFWQIGSTIGCLNSCPFPFLPPLLSPLVPMAKYVCSHYLLLVLNVDANVGVLPFVK